MKQNPALLAFNRGLVSPIGLARVDQKRLALAAETMTNWMPRVLGSMALRPGLGYIGATASNAAARYLPFVFSTTDTALLELTNALLRVWVNDALITRAAVSTAVLNGDFTNNLTNWTDDDEAGATSQWAAGGYMQLVGTGTNAAMRTQQVTVAAGDRSVEHALRIVINRGPVVLRVGSTSGGDEYIAETTLATGTHSLTLTPTANFYIRFQSRLGRITLVDSCNVEAAGVMTLPTPWPAASLSLVRGDQSGDVVFVACQSYAQRRIERRSTRSWSVVQYLPEDGPFRTQNVGPITITASAITGNITLTASAALFKSTQAPSANSPGALFQITPQGQTVSSNISAQNTFTNSITVTGTSTGRSFSISLSGTWVATVTLQRSFDGGSTWIDVQTWAANVATTSTDGLDNQEVKYRIGVKTGDYTSGTVVAQLTFTSGSITGVVRITAFSSSTSVSAEVLTDLGATTSTDVWAEGKWSDYRGWPTTLRLYEGRLWWFGKDNIDGSVSDAFDSFDPNYEGDAGPISRTIGSGPVDVINWALGLQRLVVGAQGAEKSVKSSSLDEPLTRTNFNIKDASTEGSAAIDAIKIGKRGAYIDRTGIKVYEIAIDPNDGDYGSNDLTAFVPELGRPGIVRFMVQMKPDVRLHCVRSDGTAMVAVYDRHEQVICWIEVETDGAIEDVVVLPGNDGDTEDKVYYVVKRTINGATVRYLEKWAKETECRGTFSEDAALNKQADSFIVYDGSIAATITNLNHLEGEAVVVWGDGTDRSPGVGAAQTTYTVSGGSITLPTAVSKAVIGLPYQAQWKSAKLGVQMSAIYSTLTREKRAMHIGLVLAYMHAKGLQYGPDFDNLDDLPEIEEGGVVGADTVWEAYDQQPIEFPTTWLSDARVCLQANAPRPATVMAAALELEIS